ncbi:amino acid ABC transporter permease, partial [Vibrio parahaemolyticus]|nr:amino acid ABC transporter permease [Vibrio parahaemolyticus]
IDIYTFFFREYLVLILFVSQAVRWLEKRIAITSY